MTDRATVVTEARTWLGTPFVHQAHVKSVGCDCGGLIGGVGIGAGLLAPDWWETEFNTLYGGYARTPANGILESICYAFMQEIGVDSALPGDVLLMKFAEEPQHMAILAPYLYGGLSIIHAYSRAGAVVEHRFAPVWRARVTGAFAYRGVT